MHNKICTVIMGPGEDQVADQINKAMQSSDLVEFRLDYFDFNGMDALRKLREMCTKPVIFTLRSRAQGGAYQGTEEQRILDLWDLAKLKPDYFDLEFHIPLPLVDLFIREYPEVKIIYSYHNFTKTPHKLHWIHKQLKRVDAAFYKIATMANTTTDVLRLLRFLEKAKRNCIALPMGEKSGFGRVLGAVYGNAIAYVCLDHHSKSATGQLTQQELEETYFYSKLNRETKVYGLIGNPVEQSPSHVTHNQYFHENGINAVYVKMVVEEGELEDFIHHMKMIGFSGLSVTSPLKERVLPFIKHIDPEAEKIGAVNTIKVVNGSLYGYNTDGIGGCNALEKYGPLTGKKIVFIGAGGSVMAMVYESMKRGAIPIVLNRTEKHATDIGKRLGCQSGPLSAIASQDYDILVNGTTVEMPIEEEWILPSAVVMEMKMKPKETQLLTAAINKGCRVVYGIEMFHQQAREQFKIWNYTTI